MNTTRIVRKCLEVTRQKCVWAPCLQNACGFSTSSSKFNDKLYEYRAYYVQPKDVKSFVELCKEHMGLRMKHSKALGYWISEIGGINDMVHIWEYDSLKQRAGVRSALANDPDWMAQFITKMMPWIIRQDNSLMKCLPGTEVRDPPSNGGVYETQMFSYQGKSLEEVTQIVQNIQRPSATLLGSWYTLVGIQNTGYLLWHHPDQDNVVSSPYNGESGVTVVQSRLLLPTAWSPMQ